MRYGILLISIYKPTVVPQCCPVSPILYQIGQFVTNVNDVHRGDDRQGNMCRFNRRLGPLLVAVAVRCQAPRSGSDQTVTSVACWCHLACFLPSLFCVIKPD